MIICASHTHRGPLWPYYKDALVTPIAEAVALAVRDLTPCRLGTSKGKAVGVSECRRVIKNGKAWDRWLLPPGEASECPAEGPADPEFDVLVVIGKDRRYKAVVYNFACHAAYTRELVVSADYPGDVQQYVQKYLGYDVPTLFLTGACGDVNPVAYSMADAAFQELVLKGTPVGARIRFTTGEGMPLAKNSAEKSCDAWDGSNPSPTLRFTWNAGKWPCREESTQSSSERTFPSSGPDNCRFSSGRSTTWRSVQSRPINSSSPASVSATILRL